MEECYWKRYVDHGEEGCINRIEAALKSLQLDPSVVERTKECFVRLPKIYDPDRSFNALVLAGPNAPLKRQFARAVAQSLEMAFEVVNGRAFKVDGKLTGREHDVVESVEVGGTFYQRAVRVIEKEPSFIDWLVGAPPGYSSLDRTLGDALAETLCSLVFLENIDHADFAFFRSVRNMIDSGVVRHRSLEKLSVDYAFFMISTSRYDGELATYVGSETLLTATSGKRREKIEVRSQELWREALGNTTVMCLAPTLWFP